MLQINRATQQIYRATPSPEERTQAFDPGHLIGILKRRIFYFAIPFVLLFITGFLVVAIQRPIFEAEGKILVEFAGNSDRPGSTHGDGGRHRAHPGHPAAPYGAR